ncbi:hypothetical protein HJFPF1_10431 [Paramyrothecium foliicola]|nr:hypothetical protein HJFPF1_10431 [Paramyrothecium foliicola]
MSGFEIAGVVLGAFPIALEALRQYEIVKTHIKRWRAIQEDYAEYRGEIRFQQLLYEDNLRNLLVDTAIDKQITNDLLSKPSSEHWQDPSVMRLLGSSYYQPYTDVEFVQEKLGNTPSLNRLTDIRFQLWRVSFSSGEKGRQRKRLLEQLQGQDLKLQKLLKMSRIATRRMDGSSTTEPIIVDFWKQANHLFEAVTGAWSCNACQGHSAWLLLQHRTKAVSDFNVIFTNESPYRTRICWTMISEHTEQVSRNPNRLLGQVDQNQTQPMTLETNLGGSATTTIVKRQKIAVAATSVDSTMPAHISNMCSALDVQPGNFCGCLSTTNMSFYVYRLSQQESDSFHYKTLEEILAGQAKYGLTRKQRYRLSLTLASSLLQLLQTPWLSNSWSKTDIIFPNEESNTRRVLLDQPHLNGCFKETQSKATKSKESLPYPLDLLGIVLLELCFGRRLEERLQPQNPVNHGYQLLAALEWQKEVEAETGSMYAQAVAWCLVGYRLVPSENLRQAMFENVVKPLETIHKFIFA